MVEENNNSVTLRIMGGGELVLLKAEIEGMNIRAKSLMPEGLVDHYSTAEMADLMAYLRATR